MNKEILNAAGIDADGALARLMSSGRHVNAGRSGAYTALWEEVREF